MSQNGRVINIPVQFKEAGNTMAQIMQTLQKAVREVDLESSLGKKLTSMMNSLQNQLDDYTQLTIEPTIDQTSLRKAERLMQTFVQRAGKIDTAIQQGNVFDFNLSSAEIDEISDLTAKVRELNAELAKLKKNGSSRATDSYLQEIGEDKLLDRARKASKTFKSDASLSKNQTALEAETKQARDNIARLQAEQNTLQEQINAYKAQLRQQQAALRNAQQASNKSKAIVDTGDFLTQFETFDYKRLHTKSGQLRGQTAVLGEFMDALMKDSEGGRIAEQNRHGAEMLLKRLGFDAATITTVLTQQEPQIRAAIAQALDIVEGSTDPISTQAYDRLTRAQSFANGYMRNYATETRYTQYVQEQQAVRDAQEAVDRTNIDLTKVNKAATANAEEIRNLQAMAAELESVTQALANFATALNQLETRTLQGKIDDAEQALDQKKADIKNAHIGNTTDLPNQRGHLTDLRRAGMDTAKSDVSMQDESEQFTNNLKQSIKHWMSAQQVINMVKDGIRQAYQDIQGLDKAMTNIAVVTDMSIGDLWGKINEYMSIAQQYGVTTQGVYEVSQLYYQQGLSTAEVMAATTETLKMARIAGMGYAEAADAMTVAIRAFKMEMSDAQHITDVYSKVAAVTASDTEELAIAMSKTASSAESVGSSFENTTAMLAVMIETTRESAQNLGSALKSIISRYGEMKVGLTVDSEGEEIDYNKVDTALKSVGISIKDAQGQFRDFDDVIFELSKKWDSLDKNTQRYIATIMAGNRQQSRFIALVDNWERLDEVAGAAQDSEDAGLLQYAKTLDSVETKLNNIKTSFQQFYMSVFNGEFVGGILDFVNSIIKALNKLGTLGSIFNIATIISGLKTGLRLIVNLVGTKFTEIYKQYQLIQQQMTQTADQESRKRANIQAQNEIAGQQQIPQGYVRQRRVDRAKQQKLSASSAKIGKASNALSLLGLGVNILGTASIANNWFGDKSKAVGTGINTAGNTLSGVGTGMAIGAAIGTVVPVIGNVAGAAIGGVIGGLIPLISGTQATIEAVKAIEEERYARLSEELEEKKIESAQASERYKSLNSYIDKLKELESTRFDSDENMKEWVDLNAQVLESYPELFSTFDEHNNAIVDLTSAEATLTQTRLEAAAAAKEMADKQVEAALSKETISKATETVQYGSLSKSSKLYLSGGGGTGSVHNPTIFIGDTVYDDLIAQGYATGTRDQGALNRGGLLQVNRIENKNDIGAYNISELMDLETNTEGVGWLIRYMGLDDEARFAELRRLAENPDEMARYFDEGTTIDQVVSAATNKTFDTYNEMAATLNTATREVDQSSQALNAAVLSGVRTYINASTLHLDKNSSYLALGNSNAAMQSYLYEAFMASGMDWKTWTTDYSGYATAFETIDAWFTEFYDQLELLGQVDEYNTFVKNSNLYTPEEYQAMLETFPMGDELQALLMEQFYEGLTKTRTNFAKALDRFNFGVFEGKDAAYIEGYLSEVLNDSIPKNYTDEVIAYADHLQNLVDTGKLTNSAAGELFNTYLDLWKFIDTNIADQEDKLLARKLLAEADLTSAEGVAKFIDSLEDAGIDIDEATIKSLLPAALMNLNTAYSSLQNKIASNIDKTATAISNLEKGLDSYSEVVEMAEKYGLSITDDFEFQDGKWYLANNAESIDKVTKGVQADIDTEKQLVKEKTDEQIRIVQTDTPTDWDTLTYKEGWDDVQVPLNGLKNVDGEYVHPELAAIIESNWDAYIAWYNEQDETASRTFIDYLQARQTEILTDLETQGEKLTEWQLAALERASAIRARTNELSNHYDKETVAGYNSLSSKLTGYTPEEIATLEQQLGFKLTDYITQDADSGLYSIDKSVANLSSIPLEYRNQIISLVESEEKAALDAIKALGASAAKGDKGVYGEAFSNSMGYQAAEALIPQWLKAISENRTIGDGLDPNALLRENIAKELSARTGQTYTATSPEVIEAANEMIAGYNDGMDANILRYIELKKKELFGTITEAEKLELNDIVNAGGLSAELTGAFANAGSKTIEKYIAVMKAAIASGADFEEVEQYIKDGYSAQLQQLATGVEDIPTLDAFDIMKNISEAEGQYTNDMLASMFSQVYAETGNEVNMSDFSEYFEIDPETKNWVLKAGKSVNNFLAQEYGGNVPEWITSAFSTSEAQKTVNDAIELDDLGTNVTNTVGTMMTDLANASLSDLVSLYESIHGEGSFADSGLLESYQAALEAAKRGETSALIAILQTLTQAAINAGADVDTTQIQATVKDAHNTLVSGLVTSINNGLSGTLSNVDFNNLIEQIGGAPEAYRKYVTETYDGLKLSAEGALVIASQLIDKFGNTSLVAESLVAQLGGSGALGSYEDVDNLINDIINDTDHWAHGNEEILKLLYQMRDEYSQLAEDAQFDFMNQDHFDGAADNWYTFTDNMSTAIDKLKTAFEKGGKIDYKSFDNIVTWISDLSVDGLDTQLGNTGKTLGEFTDAVLATVDATGNLDLSAAAANLGISMDDMAGALEGGLQEVAKQQVAYWKNYLNFLKGIKALQEASDEIIIEPPQVDINNEGKYTYGGQDNLTAEQAYSYWLTDIYKNFENLTITDFDGNTVQIFSGNNNPLRQLMSFKPELFTIGDDGSVQIKEGMASYVQQYMNQLNAWVKQEFATGDITKYIDQETGAIKIPWNEVLQIEIDTSGTSAGTATNTEEAGEQTQAAAEGAAESALTASGATSDGNGNYTYTLDDMTLKIQMGANGSVEIDLTNATGTLPSAAELRKVFEGQEGFTATDDNNWIFTDPNLGFSVKCSNGTLSFDTSGMTAPAAPTAAELSAILGTAWTTTDGGKTYTTNLNGVSFVYNSATGKININASSFQLTGGLDATSLATILGGTWTTEDNGATYTATIAGTSFVYESSSGLVKINGSKFTLSGGLSATELATILGGSWSSPDGGITYESTINGVTFTYKSASGTVEIDSSKFTLSAGLSTEQLTALLGGTWSTEDGITYKSVISGVTFTYESTTGTISVDPSGFTVSANLTADQLKTLLGGTWTSEDGVTYKSTINGVTFTYESTTGKLVVTPPTTATEPTNADFVTLMQTQGWTHTNGVYTKNFGGGTLTYNATAGTLTITPSATMAAANPDMATLLDSAFGAGGWQLNENGGYDILNATTGEVLYTLPAKITIAPTADSNVTSGDNGLTADVDVALTPNTKAIDDALSAYEGKTINLTIGISKNSSIKSSQHFETAAAALFGTSDWDTFLNTKNWSFLDGSNQDLAEEAFGSLVTQASVLSNANQLTQEDVDLIIALGEAMGEAGINVSAAMETVSSLATVEDNTVLADLTTFAEAFGGANLFGNLTALTALLTAMTNPAAVSLDLTGFITQLQSMGELELDDEEINNFVTAITALTTAITALPTEVNVSVKVSAGSSYSVINSIKNALAGIKNKTVTITTKHVSSGGDEGDSGEENPGTPTDASYAGNVSGLALAKGNTTDKLLAGAHLAGKTLVGELGPELAVYDNQYHLLGRNGAEFVDLPNDAIVFNHRQTAGIIKGQAGYRGQALVNGNVTGPAAAGGIDAAISAVEKIIKLWSNIADSSLSDLLSGGSNSGGGGSGNTIKAVTEELQEWYNLSRQIEHIEQEINNLIAERANLLESDGAAYLRSLREEQALLRDQVATQETLLQYQQLQLKRQADQINQNDIWSKFLEVDENGLLQYKNGNEANGGKGALDVLQGLNEMSGEEQIEYLKKIGYSYATADGEKLEGEDLVKQFFQEFQDQIDSYDSLYDTVHQTEEKLQQLATSIEEINQEIKENQMDLEQEIFDILVEAWEAEIEALEEQKELIEEANEAYISGLQEALQAERDMYSDNERLADREQLQRQLSLLRRSGGSASEIASLEEQLDSMLKEEYFNKQEDMIQNIQDANDEQIRLLDEQLRLEQESLEYQKENGILWSKVYEIMSGSTEDILAFMQGNAPNFFTQSALQQEQMLTEWAKKVGIYTENRKYEEHESYAKEQVWDTGAIWQQEGMGDLKSTYEGLSSEGQNTVRDQFASAYASARIAGKSHEEALSAATDAVKKTLEDQQDVDDAEGNDPPTTNPNPSGNSTMYVTGGKLHLRQEASKNSKSLGTYPTGTAVKILSKHGDWYKVEVDGKTGYMMGSYLTSTKPGSDDDDDKKSSSSSKKYRVRYTVYFVDGQTQTGSGVGNSPEAAKKVAESYAKKKTKSPKTAAYPGGAPVRNIEYQKAVAYSKGGLVDYTGLALVHGKPGQPEAFLNAKQTAMISEAVKSAGDGGALDGIKATLAALNSTIHSITNNNTTQTSSFTVAPGAVTIQVAQLNDSYDVEELSKDVMNRMVAIASKSTNRGVNRR